MAEVNSRFSITRFKQAIAKQRGFSRGYLFDIDITLAQNVPNRITFPINLTSYQCRSVQLPSFTLETTQVSYMAATASLPGKRTYDPLTLSFYNTNSEELHEKFILWQNRIRGFDGGRGGDAQVSVTSSLPSVGDILDPIGAVRRQAEAVVNQTVTGGTSPSYTALIELRHYREDERRIASYKLQNAFPTMISGMSYSQDSDGEFQTFDVTFAYQYMEYQKL